MTKRMQERQTRIRRFGLSRIVEHAMVIVAVGVLVLTGLSQKFHEFDVSQWVILGLGGIDNVRLIHRYAGAAFSAMMLVHILVAAFGLSVRKWQPTMMINKKDLLDAVHNIKYYIGVENEPARCGRYDYKQKLVYWGVLTGGLLMILTGLTLWFPTLAARFLPGEAIPVAKALHTNEALLIFLLISVWHIYDSIFSPDVFPLDTSIFTGYISRRRMLREHPLELARIEGVSVEELLGRPSGKPEGARARKAAF
jgi:formate dehydrogenase gamma subunit